MIISKRSTNNRFSFTVRILMVYTFCIMRGITLYYMNTLIEVILLFLAYNLHTRNPNLACVLLTNMGLSANYHAHVYCVRT